MIQPPFGMSRRKSLRFGPLRLAILPAMPETKSYTPPMLDLMPLSRPLTMELPAL